MAITFTPVQGPSTTPATPNRLIGDIVATADADATLVIAHGMAGIPQEVHFTIFGANAAEGALSLWGYDSADATNIVIRKTTAVGSGAAGIQCRMTAKLPHTVNG